MRWACLNLRSKDDCGGTRGLWSERVVLCDSARLAFVAPGDE